MKPYPILTATLLVCVLSSCGPTYTKTHTKLPREAAGWVTELEYVPSRSTVRVTYDWDGNQAIRNVTVPAEHHVTVESPELGLVARRDSTSLYNQVQRGSEVALTYQEAWEVTFDRETRQEIPGSWRLLEYRVLSITAVRRAGGLPAERPPLIHERVPVPPILEALQG